MMYSSRLSLWRGMVLLTALMFVTLGGCSKDEKEATSANATRDQKTVLNVWHTEVDPQAKEAMEQIIEDFERDYPNVNVEQQAIRWGQLNERLTTAINAGEGAPDVAQLQPYMTSQLVYDSLLLPIDTVFEVIGESNIFPAVKDLQKFGDHYYGLAYAVGATFFAVRSDWLNKAGLKTPTTWKEFESMVRELTVDEDNDGYPERYGLILPGTPFFVDQLAAELVASNGGGFFDRSGVPTFTDSRVIEMLEFFRDISKYAPPDWTSYDYLDQFQVFASGKVACVPVCYARALKNIESDADADISDERHFGFIPQPHGPSGKYGTCTMDCENWVVLKSSKHSGLAKAFLTYFYRDKNYLKFCQTVPIHLTPITKNVATSEAYMNTPFVTRWETWQKQTNEVLSRADRALPILLSRVEDRNIPFLMELSGKRIITDMVVSVCKDGVSPEDAAAEAQKKALEIMNSSF